MLSKAQLNLIHVARNQLDMADEQYRQIIGDRFGVTSSKDLKVWQFKELLEIFEKLGFVKITGELTQGQYKKIRKLANLKSWNRSRLNGFVKRQLGKSKAVETLTKKEAVKVIDGLKNVG